MRDPAPENITGSMIRKHEFSHTIRWDYLVLAAVAGYVALKLFGGLAAIGGAGDRDELGEPEVVSSWETTKGPGFADGGD